ncbi:MAG: hypothetical protein IAF02_11515, partial [Anaerolineae bacterium]|nr:hypothetical protein [Anaerolineae bacterium]
MGTKPQHTRGINLDKDDDALVSWINRQIETGDFTTLSTWLEDINFGQYDRSRPSEIQKTAIQLCQICKNHQEEMDASWAAYQRAVTQEKALSANLANILKLLVEQTGNRQLVVPGMSHAATERPFAAPSPSPSDTIQTGVWQRVQNFFNRPQIQSDVLDSESISPEKAIPIESDTPAEETPVPTAAISKSHVTKKRNPDIQEYEYEMLPRAEEQTATVLLQEPTSVMTQTNTEIIKKREGIPFLTIYTLGSFRVYQDDIPILE